MRVCEGVRAVRAQWEVEVWVGLRCVWEGAVQVVKAVRCFGIAQHRFRARWWMEGHMRGSCTAWRNPNRVVCQDKI
jgi:hypothetical protein